MPRAETAPGVLSQGVAVIPPLWMGCRNVWGWSSQIFSLVLAGFSAKKVHDLSDEVRAGAFAAGLNSTGLGPVASAASSCGGQWAGWFSGVLTGFLVGLACGALGALWLASHCARRLEGWCPPGSVNILNQFTAQAATTQAAVPSSPLPTARRAEWEALVSASPSQEVSAPQPPLRLVSPKTLRDGRAKNA